MLMMAIVIIMVMMMMERSRLCWQIRDFQVVFYSTLDFCLVFSSENGDDHHDIMKMMMMNEMIPDLQLQCFQMLPVGLKPSWGKNQFPMWNHQSTRKSPENKAKTKNGKASPPKIYIYLFSPLI